MKKCLLAACLSLLAFAATPARAEADIRQEVVQFKKGQSSTTIKGSVRGDSVVDYRLRAAAGQTLEVTMQASKASANFNVLPPGDETALFVGSTSGSRFAGELPRDGDYTVRVYLLGNAASSNQTANYTLDFRISARTGAKGPPASSRYDATGRIRCSVGNPALDEWCDFRVVRHAASGGAQIWISHGGSTRDRVLHFAGRKFTSDEGAALPAQRQGDDWRVNAGSRIYYLIPDALLYGG
jgi:hypothetical protein